MLPLLFLIAQTLNIEPNLHHVQGIDIEANTLWISSVDAKAAKGYLSKLNLTTGQLLLQIEVQDGNRIHPGGITLDGDSLWIPVAAYNRKGPTIIQRRNKNTLALEFSFPVEDHIGCIAASKTLLIVGNWDSRILYQFSKDGKQLAATPNPQPTAYQDLKFDGTHLLASGNLSKSLGAIQWLTLPNYTLARQITLGTTDRNITFTNEGMTLRNNNFYLLPEDAPTRLFTFPQ